MYCRAGYQQSLPLTWLQDPNEQNRMALLEFSRGVLYSLSNSNKQHGGEVHISRLRHAFDKLGSPSLCRVGIKLLNFLREAESLPGGYWIPTPFRVLEIEGYPVFIGSLPTELGFLGKIATDGLCRLLTSEVAARFPLQDIGSWMGVSSSTPTSQVISFFQQHQRIARPISNQTDLEYLGFATTTSKCARKDRQFVWGPRPSVLTDNQIALCRQKNFGFYRYFSADLHSGHAISEAAIEQSIPRLLFALAHYTGTPVTVSVRNGIDSVEVSIAEHLPAEEYRLALLLSRCIVRQGRRRTFHLAPQLAPALIGRLQDLGCIMETDK